MIPTTPRTRTPLTRSVRSRTLLASACALLIALLGACSQTPAAPALPAAPSATINAPSSVLMGASVPLDATGSSGDDLSYSWSFLSHPAGSGVVLSSGGSATSGFTPDMAGTYVLQVEVSNAGGSDTAVVTIEVAFPDVAGAWNAIFTPDGNPPVPLTLNLVQNDASISGTVTDGTDHAPISGELGPDGTTIVFSWGGGSTVITTTATFGSGFTTMTGSFTINIAPPNSGSFSATRM